MQKQSKPILLFNDECAVCRHIGHWVQRSAQSKSGEPSILVQPIGDDPGTLRSLNPDLDIWDAYATIHVLMPDGSMRLGGEAVAETLRNLPNTRWFAWSFATTILGFRPFQVVLNLAYAILADVRPLFGCESCGKSKLLRPIQWVTKWAKKLFGGGGPHPRGGRTQKAGQYFHVREEFANEGKKHAVSILNRSGASHQQ